jgi:hypothetical protein
MREHHIRKLFDAAATYYAYENSVFASDSVSLVQSSQAFSELMIFNLRPGSIFSRQLNGSTEFFAQSPKVFDNLAVFHRKAGLVLNTDENLELLMRAATNTAQNTDYLEGYGDHLKELENTCMAYHISTPVHQEKTPSKGDAFLKRVISLKNQFNWFENEAKIDFVLDMAISLMNAYPELGASLGYANRSKLEDGSLTIKLTSDRKFGRTDLLIEFTDVESNVITSINHDQDCLLTVSQNPQVNSEAIYTLKYHSFPLIKFDISSYGEALNTRPELDEESLYAPLETSLLNKIVSQMFNVGLPVTLPYLKEVGGQIRQHHYAKLLDGCNVQLGTDYLIDELLEDDAETRLETIWWLVKERPDPLDVVGLAAELSKRDFDLDKLINEGVSNPSENSLYITVKESLFYEVYQSLELAKVLDSSIEDAFTPLDDINHETEASFGFSL